jgi:hypothetical protein
MISHNAHRLVSITAVAGLTVFSSSSFAAPTISTDNGTTIGTMTTPKNYGSGYSGFWRSGAPDYTLLTDGHDTFLNAPSSGGNIHLRALNAGADSQHPDLVTIEPNGELSLHSTGAYAIIGDVKSVPGDFGIGIQMSASYIGVWAAANGPAPSGQGSHPVGVLGSSNTGHGIRGNSSGTGTATDPVAGVYGYASQASNVAGVIGESGATGGTGVYGKTVAGSTGVFGVTSGNGKAVLGYNPDFSGYAVYASGNAGGTTGWANGSDLRLKKDVTDLSHGLKDVLALRPVSYRLKDSTDGTFHIGFIAQELQRTVPEVVHEDGKGMLSVTYTELIPLLTKAIQDQERRIEELEHARGTVLSAISPQTIGGVMLGLLPLGLVLMRNRNRTRDESGTNLS